MLIFGEGGYHLPIIKGIEGIEYFECNLTSTHKKELLANPPLSNIDYLIKALLFKTALEFESFRESERIWQILNEVEYSLDKTLDIENHEQKSYYRLNLDTIGQIPGIAYRLWNEEDKVIARVLITLDAEGNEELCIFSKEPLILEGETLIPSLRVYSLAEVIIDDNLAIENNLFVHATAITTPDHNTLETKKIILHCENECLLSGILKAKEIEIQAGHYLAKNKIEADQLQIVTERGWQEGSLQVRKNLRIVALAWKNHPNSHIHCPGTVNYLIIDLDDHGLLTTNELSLTAVDANFQGKYYVGHSLRLHTQKILRLGKKAHFICNGKVEQYSELSALIDGRLRYDPHLKVSWDSIIDPNLPYDALHPAPLELSFPQFLPYIPLAERDRISYLTEVEPEVSKSAMIHINAQFLVKLSGDIEIKGAHLNVSTSYLLKLLGRITQANFQNAYSLNFQGQEVELMGFLSSEDSVRTVAKGAFTQSGGGDSHQWLVKAANYTLETNSTLRCDYFSAEVEESLSVLENSRFHVNDTSYLKCGNFVNYSELYSRKLFIEGSSYIYNRGSLTSLQQAFVAPLVVSLGHLNSRVTSVTAYLSFIGGLNKIGHFNDNSVISFAPGLSIQNMLAPISVTAAALTFVNVGLTVCDYLVPGARPITMALRFGLNALSQSARVYHEAKRLAATYQMTGMGASDYRVNSVRAVTTLLQAALTTGLATTSIVSNSQHLSFNADNLSSFSPTLQSTLEASFANSLTLFSGYTNSSVLSVNTGAFLGIARNSSSLFAINADLNLGLTKVSNNLYSLDSSFNLDGGPTSSSGFENLSAGEYYSLIGQHNLNYTHTNISSLLPFSHEKWNIEAKELTIHRKTGFVNSTIHASHLVQNESLRIDHSTLGVEVLMNKERMIIKESQLALGTVDQSGSLGIDHSAGSIHSLVNKSVGDVDIESSSLTINHFANQGHSIFAETTLSLGVAENKSEVAFDQSKVDIQLLDNSGTALITNSVALIENLNNASQLQLINTHVKIENLDNCGITADVDIESSSLTINHLANQGHSIFYESTLSLGVTNNQGEVAFDQSKVEIQLLDNSGTALITNSVALIENLNNASQLQLVNTHARIENLDNSGITAIDGCQLQGKKIINEAGASLGIRDSQIVEEKIVNQGRLVSNDSYLLSQSFSNQDSLNLQHSILESKEISGYFSKSHFLANGSKIYTQSRISDLEYKKTTTNPEFRVHMKVLLPKSDSKDILVLHSSPTDELKNQFKASQPKLSYQEGKISYQYNSDLTMNGWNLISVLPLSYEAPNIVLKERGLHSGVELTLKSTHHLSIDRTQLKVEGGFYAQAGDYAKIQASTILTYEMTIDGVKGLTVAASVKSERVEHHAWRWRGLHSGMVSTVDISTSYLPVNLTATQGAINLYSSQGKGLLKGAIILGPSINVHTHDSAKLLDLQARNIHEVTTCSLFGYNNQAYSQSFSAPSALLSQSNIDIQSETSEIFARGLIALAPQGDIKVFAPLSVAFTRPILNHFYSQTLIGITYLNTPFSSTINPLDFMPLIQSIDQLLQSTNGLSVAFNTANVVAEGVNKANVILNDLNQNASWIKLGLDGVFSPALLSQLARVNVGVGQTQIQKDYQTLGAGLMTAKSIQLQSQMVNIRNAYALNADQCRIKANELNYMGATLNSKAESLIQNIDFSIGLVGLDGSLNTVGVGASIHESSREQVQHLVSTPHLKYLDLEVGDAQFRDARISVEELSGQVKELDIHSSIDTISTHSLSVGVSDSSAQYSQHHSYNESIAQKSCLEAKEASNFQVGDFSLSDASKSSNLHSQQFHESQSSLAKQERHLAISAHYPVSDKAKATSQTVFYPLKVDSGYVNGAQHSETKITVPLLNSKGWSHLTNNRDTFVKSHTLSSSQPSSTHAIANALKASQRAAHATPKTSPLMARPKHLAAHHASPLHNTPDAIEKCSHKAADKTSKLIQEHKADLEELAHLPAAESKPAVDYLTYKTGNQLAKVSLQRRLIKTVGISSGVLGLGLDGYKIYKAEPKDRPKVASHAVIELTCASVCFEAGLALLSELPPVGLALITTGFFSCSPVAEKYMEKKNIQPDVLPLTKGVFPG